MNESGLLDGFFIFYRSKKIVFKKKLELIEDRYLASIWKWLVQRSIEESMEIATPDWTFPLIPQWDADQNIPRSMPDNNRLNAMREKCNARKNQKIVLESKVTTNWMLLSGIDLEMLWSSLHRGINGNVQSGVTISIDSPMEPSTRYFQTDAG